MKFSGFSVEFKEAMLLTTLFFCLIWLHLINGWRINFLQNRVESLESSNSNICSQCGQVLNNL